jgi:hypothetical protein
VIIRSSSSGATRIWSTTWPISFSFANALTPLPPRVMWRYSSIGVRLPNAYDVTIKTSLR